MSFIRPTLPELRDRIEADLVSRLNTSGSILSRSFVYVLSQVLAGAAHLLHGHLEWIAKQIFPDSSEEEFLIRQAAIFGVTRAAPTYTKGEVIFTATGGGVIPAGTVITDTSGNEYTVDETVDSAPTPPYIKALVTAVVPGSESRIVVSQTFRLEAPIAGVTDEGTASGFFVEQGQDEEDVESLRVRLLERIAEPAHGGTVADYVAWAKSVAGVTRVWVTPLGLGPGTVVVRFARDGDSLTAVPDAGEIAEVQGVINNEKPVHAAVTVAALVDQPIAFTIAVTPNTVDVKAAVTAELTDLIREKGAPGATILLSAIRTAIGRADGLTDYTMTAPAGNVVSASNELPRLGTITWT